MDVLQLNIKLLDSSSHSITCSSSDVVSAVKTKVRICTGVVEERQRLIFRGRVLRNEKTLQECSVSTGQTIHMVERGLSKSTSEASSSPTTRVRPRSLSAPNAHSIPPIFNSFMQSDGENGASIHFVAVGSSDDGGIPNEISSLLSGILQRGLREQSSSTQSSPSRPVRRRRIVRARRTRRSSGSPSRSAKDKSALRDSALSSIRSLDLQCHVNSAVARTQDTNEKKENVKDKQQKEEKEESLFTSSSSSSSATRSSSSASNSTGDNKIYNNHSDILDRAKESLQNMCETINVMQSGVENERGLMRLGRLFHYGAKAMANTSKYFEECRKEKKRNDPNSISVHSRHSPPVVGESVTSMDFPFSFFMNSFGNDNSDEERSRNNSERNTSESSTEVKKDSEKKRSNENPSNVDFKRSRKRE